MVMTRDGKDDASTEGQIHTSEPLDSGYVAAAVSGQIPETKPEGDLALDRLRRLNESLTDLNQRQLVFRNRLFGSRPEKGDINGLECREGLVGATEMEISDLECMLESCCNLMTEIERF